MISKKKTFIIVPLWSIWSILFSSAESSRPRSLIRLFGVEDHSVKHRNHDKAMWLHNFNSTNTFDLMMFWLGLTLPETKTDDLFSDSDEFLFASK